MCPQYRAFTGITASAMAVMAPVPALANASADVMAPVLSLEAATPATATAAAATGAAGVAAAPVAEGERKFRNLFATWQARDDKARQGLVAFRIPPTSVTGQSVSGPSVSVPSRMPVESTRFSSNFGMRNHPVSGGRKMHTGLDIPAPSGTPIYATADGTVETAKWFGGYGLYVQLAHGGDMETRYGHMSRLNVSAGQRVKKGELIGFVGSTGRSTGPHLHYEVRIAGQAVNPEPYLHPRSGASLASGNAARAVGGPE